jgi:hypothetical protein
VNRSVPATHDAHDPNERQKSCYREDEPVGRTVVPCDRVGMIDVDDSDVAEERHFLLSGILAGTGNVPLIIAANAVKQEKTGDEVEHCRTGKDSVQSKTILE